MRNDPLFELIESLTPSEKRYFRLSAEPGSVSLNLFDQIVGIPDCTDDLLRRTEAENRQSLPTDLPAAKYKLRKLLLRSLSAYHSGKQPSSEIRGRIEEIEVLLNRRLEKQASKLLESTLAKARKYEFHSVQIELLNLKLRMTTEYFPPQVQEIVRKVNEEMSGIIGRMQRESMLNGLFREVVVHYRHQPGMDDHDRVRRIQEIESDPLVQQKAPTVTGEIFRLHIMASIRFMNGRSAESLDAAQKLYDTYELHPHFKSLNLARYHAGMQILLNSCLYQKEKDLFEKYLDEVIEFAKRFPRGNTEHLRRIYFMELFFCLNYSNEIRGRELARTLPIWLEKNASELTLTTRHNFYHNLATYQFLHGEFAAALAHVNFILNHPSSELGIGIQRNARILQMVIHFQLGNIDLIEYQIRSFGKLLDRKAVWYPYEKAIFDFFKALIMATDLAGLRLLCTEAKKTMEGLLDNFPGKQPTGYYEFLFWLDSIILQSPIKEVYQEALLKRDEAID